MVTETSLTQEIGEKMNPRLNCPSSESSLTQGDSDLESTSVSSSMQGSISSATSSLDQYSSNVRGETLQNKPLKKSISRKVASFGSFMLSRRRAQSKLSQSSIKLSEDGSTTPSHTSSIEVSDESCNYVQKPMPKFTRTGSLRSVKIFRSNSKNRNRNKSSSKSKKSSIDDFLQISEESHLERATFSSTLKDSKFPEHLKYQPRPSEPEEVLPVAKLCPYQHCSLHGHHHHHEPPTKRFAYLKKRTANDPKIMTPETRSTDKSLGKKREPKVTTKKVSDRKKDVDFSIEFYAKTRSEPHSSHAHDDAEFADILFGVNSLPERKNEIPISNDRDFSDLNDKKDDNSNGSKSVLEKKRSLKKKNRISMWGMIHQHMVSGLAAETEDIGVQKLDQEKKPETKDFSDFDDVASQETEIRKMFAIKLVRDAIEKILLPEVQDDQSTTSEVMSEQDLSNKSYITSDRKEESEQDLSDKTEITSDRKEESPKPKDEEKSNMKTKKGTPSRWSYLKKVVLLTKFVKELEKVKKFNPKKPQYLPLPPEAETETVSLRQQTAGGKKNTDEWMLDYALQKVVSELAPTQKRKVALLVKAFETVAPAQDDSQESNEIQRVGSKSKGELREISESSSFTERESLTRITEDKEVAPKEPSRSDLEREKEVAPKEPSGLDLEKEKHIKMWHMIYQHVVTDIATKIGSDLLVDDEESTNSEEKNLQEVENQTERNYRLQFTQSDAVKLVRESVDEILLPDIPDSSSQDTQSIASDVASEQEEVLEKKDDDGGEARKIEKDFVQAGGVESGTGGREKEAADVEVTWREEKSGRAGTPVTPPPSIGVGGNSVREDESPGSTPSTLIDNNKKPTIEGPLSTVTRLQHQKSKNWVKLKNMIMLKRSIKALEGFRKLKPQTPQREAVISDREQERVDLRRQMMDERKKAEQWMLDYAVQHIVGKLTPTRKKRVSMLVEAFEAVVPLPEI
ncbi:hypothetical protein SSX86_013364 [Deinandra increscens subsp. villosa]|uniref:Calmodulin-binding domain-containing protein n=1 Tax=Deinandra increscens subsp. villosa TaxID=3103831 RepID=A0AAP0DDL2_9ASTR